MLIESLRVEITVPYTKYYEFYRLLKSDPAIDIRSVVGSENEIACNGWTRFNCVIVKSHFKEIKRMFDELPYSVEICEC